MNATMTNLPVRNKHTGEADTLLHIEPVQLAPGRMRDVAVLKNCGRWAIEAGNPSNFWDHWETV